MLSTEEKVLAYTAGLFDGKGCILIQRVKNTFSLHVRVTSTDRPIVDWMHDHFGGCVGIQAPNRNIKNCRPCWYWNIQSKAASLFLARIEPLLVIKREQAKLALEFQSRLGSPGVNRIEPEEITIRETYKRRLAELKIGAAPETREGLYDPAYVAGLLDGEGTILIYKSRTYFQLSVRVVNTDLGSLERMKSLFGGNIGSKREKKSIRTRPCWTWDIQGPAAAEVLVNIYPFLIVKREQARVALEFMDRCREARAQEFLPEEKVRIGTEYKQRLSTLNRRLCVTDLARP